MGEPERVILLEETKDTTFGTRHLHPHELRVLQPHVSVLYNQPLCEMFNPRAINPAASATPFWG